MDVTAVRAWDFINLPDIYLLYKVQTSSKKNMKNHNYECTLTLRLKVHDCGTK
jgi:hypothetical protein